MAPAIQIKNISKRFRLYHEKQQTLKERFIRFGARSYDDLWALDDVSFDVEEGQTFGLMGHNGSGKSTLLKLIGGILQPTSGEIITKGRIAALLELGAGMQPDLTGRENIFLNGSILGLSRKELEKRFDEIVAFSELEDFIDTQVRLYSSGMYVRLGFAVAVNVDPDILLVDEVLAVGDELFQRKCYEKVKQFQEEGRTIIVVTHSVDQIRKMGDSAAVLEHGKLIFTGEPSDSIRVFREHLFFDAPETLKDKEAHSKEVQLDDPVNKKIEITSAGFVSEKDRTSNTIRTGEDIMGAINFKSSIVTDDICFLFEVYDDLGNLVFEASSRESNVDPISGEGTAEFLWKNVPLADGKFKANVGITSLDGGKVYDWKEQNITFEVTNDNRSLGLIHLPSEVKVVITGS